MNVGLLPSFFEITESTIVIHMYIYLGFLNHLIPKDKFLDFVL